MKEDSIILDRPSQIAQFLEDGITPRPQWRIGTEHEKFLYDSATFTPLAYEGARGIAEFLQAFAQFGWQYIYEEDRVIALERGGASITLEPGGQLELSGAPVASVHETCAEVTTHLRECARVSKELGLGLFGMGFAPLWRREDISWMPKKRYDIMRRYMPQRGKLGLDMMLRTSSIQVNLDFDCEETMIHQFRISLALQPLAQAFFANSPLYEGAVSDYLSYRGHVWRHTDDARCGDLAFVFEDGFGFERYADYVMDVPMYFYRRGGRYLDVAGADFRAFMKGALDGHKNEHKNERATLFDLRDHMSTIFTDSRLKHYLEIRGADSGGWNSICALSALWVGLLYDKSILLDVWARVKHWRHDMRLAMRDAVLKDGFRTRIRQGSAETLRDLALEILEMAQAGLEKRAILDDKGRDETIYLAPLWDRAKKGLTPAEQFLAQWNDAKPIHQLYERISY